MGEEEGGGGKMSPLIENVVFSLFPGEDSGAPAGRACCRTCFVVEDEISRESIQLCIWIHL